MVLTRSFKYYTWVVFFLSFLLFSSLSLFRSFFFSLVLFCLSFFSRSYSLACFISTLSSSPLSYRFLSTRKNISPCLRCS